MRTRAPVPDDAPAVAALMAARDVADLGAPDITLQDLRDEWRGSDVDLATDAVVIEADGGIVGYAIVRRPGSLAVVGPEHEGRGVGTRLLQWTETRERERGRPCHRQWVGASNAAARELLTAAGYRRVRSYWRLVRQLDDVAAPGPAPAGVQLRPPDLRADARALHQLDAASFASNPDYKPQSFRAFREEHLHAHDLDARLSLVAVEDDELAGFLLARRWQSEATGYVDLLGVDPRHRRRGIGSALLQGAFAAFAAAGLSEAQLSVASDNPRALRLYERLTMHTRFQADVYERPMTPGPG